MVAPCFQNRGRKVRTSSSVKTLDKKVADNTRRPAGPLRALLGRGANRDASNPKGLRHPSLKITFEYRRVSPESNFRGETAKSLPEARTKPINFSREVKWVKSGSLEPRSNPWPRQMATANL